MSVLYNHSFLYSEGGPKQSQDYMDQNSGSTRFRSTPSSYQETVTTGDEFIQSPSEELEDLLAKYTSLCNDSYVLEENCVKEEDKEFVSQSNGYSNGSEVVYGDNWSFGGMGEFKSFRTSHTVKGEFTGVSGDPSSSNSRVMPRISGIETENVQNFSNESWDKTSFGVSKGCGDNGTNFSSLNTLETCNGKSKNQLTHHLSLPATISKKSAIGNLSQIQESVQYKIRAKRGFATHPRSIAERERRTRISERMRKLQDLVPNMEKQTSTAEMLDMAVAHIKELQNQVKGLTDTRARCMCASKDKQIGSSS